MSSGSASLLVLDEANGTTRDSQFLAIWTEGELAFHDRVKLSGKRTCALPGGGFKQDDLATPHYGKPLAIGTEGDVFYRGVLGVLFDFREFGASGGIPDGHEPAVARVGGKVSPIVTQRHPENIVEAGVYRAQNFARIKID